MANTRELRRRIKSVKNTAQITKAMQMVAAARMKKAQNQALNGRPYNLSLNFALEKLLPLVNLEAHPLLSGNNSKNTGVVLLSTNKGLCGALNTNLFRFLTTANFLTADSIFYTVGKKGRSFVAKTGKNLQADFENLDTVNFKQVVQIAKLLIDAFLAGEIKEAYAVYPNFVSTLRQEPAKIKLLPIDLELITTNEVKQSQITASKTPQSNNRSEFLFEPNPDRLLDFILLHYVRIKIYQALLETKASEQSARMMAMQNATDNAMELVDDLTLTYNQTRQDAITRELLEITTAAAAMS